MRKTMLAMLVAMVAVSHAAAGQTDDRHGQRTAEPAPQYGQHDKPDSRNARGHSKTAPLPPPPVATPEQVQLIAEYLRDEGFDDRRYKAAMLCVHLTGITVDGLRVMAKEFSFDDNRLKFLKDAYQFCPDREKYWMLEDCFTFRTNGEELMRYVRSHYQETNK